MCLKMFDLKKHKPFLLFKNIISIKILRAHFPRHGLGLVVYCIFFLLKKYTKWCVVQDMA